MGRHRVGALCAVIVLGAALFAMGAGRAGDARVTGPIKLAGMTSADAPAVAQPVPELSAQTQAERALQNLYKSEYEGTAPADRAALARKLLQEGLETRDDWVSRYVMLRDARDISARCGDLSTALKAIDDLGRVYRVDAGALTIEMLNSAGQASDSVTALEGVVRVALFCMDGAAGHDDYSYGLKLGDLAEAMALRAKKPALTALVQSRIRELKDQQHEWERARAARNTLKANPGDAEAQVVAGRFAIFAHEDWNGGLPLLLTGGDAALKALAQRDLARPLDAEEQAQLGNDWWDLAERQTHVAKINLQTRAADWYRRALPQLSGIKAATVEKRLEEFDLASMAQRMLEPGVACEMFSDEKFAKRAVTRIDSQINFDWGLAAPDETMPKDNFSIRWNGVLNVRAAGRGEIVVTANSGARVIIDGRTLIDDPNMTRKRTGVKVPVEFAEGLHSMRVEFWDGGGEANIRLMWTPPGTTKEEVIPASVLYHEAAVVH